MWWFGKQGGERIVQYHVRARTPELGKRNTEFYRTGKWSTTSTVVEA
jgi:hypothetical protein